MFDETSHFISATPLTKTFSTFSSVVLSFRMSFCSGCHSCQGSKFVVDDPPASGTRSNGEMERKKVLLLFCYMLKYMPKCIQSDLGKNIEPAVWMYISESKR